MSMWRCAGEWCICNCYVHSDINVCPSNNPIVHTIPRFFFKKEILLIIIPIISFQLSIIDWKTFEISHSFIRFSVLFICVTLFK